MKELTQVELEYVAGGNEDLGEPVTDVKHSFAYTIGAFIDKLIPGNTYFAIGFDKLCSGFNSILSAPGDAFGLIWQGVTILLNPFKNPNPEPEATA